MAFQQTASPRYLSLRSMGMQTPRGSMSDAIRANALRPTPPGERIDRSEYGTTGGLMPQQAGTWDKLAEESRASGGAIGTTGGATAFVPEPTLLSMQRRVMQQPISQSMGMPATPRGVVPLQPPRPDVGTRMGEVQPETNNIWRTGNPRPPVVAQSNPASSIAPTPVLSPSTEEDHARWLAESQKNLAASQPALDQFEQSRPKAVPMPDPGTSMGFSTNGGNTPRGVPYSNPTQNAQKPYSVYEAAVNRLFAPTKGASGFLKRDAYDMNAIPDKTTQPAPVSWARSTPELDYARRLWGRARSLFSGN